MRSWCLPFLKPYTSIIDERFAWIIEVFLEYLSHWKTSIINRNVKFTTKACDAMFISNQTYEGLGITCLSMVDIIKHLLHSGIPYVFSERLCQDALENYFVRQRAIGGRKDNPTLRDFEYSDNTIRNTQATKSIVGNVSSSCQLGLGNINNIDSTPVPYRKQMCSCWLISMDCYNI